jgi:hypothetical protein
MHPDADLQNDAIPSGKAPLYHSEPEVQSPEIGVPPPARVRRAGVGSGVKLLIGNKMGLCEDPPGWNQGRAEMG